MHHRLTVHDNYAWLTFLLNMCPIKNISFKSSLWIGPVETTYEISNSITRILKLCTGFLGFRPYYVSKNVEETFLIAPRT